MDFFSKIIFNAILQKNNFFYMLMIKSILMQIASKPFLVHFYSKIISDEIS